MNTLALYFRHMPLTLVLIGVSVLMSLLSSFGDNTAILAPFLISNYPNGGLPEIRGGELWRLLTPIFIHFGYLHIIFNMLWTWDLGRALELTQGTRRLSVLVVVLGVASNLLEYAWTGWVLFGGMSGVVYGLLSYIWIQGRLDPASPLRLHREIVILMVIWYVLGWTGFIGPIANMAHTGGLVGGLVLGWLYSPRKDLRRLF